MHSTILSARGLAYRCLVSRCLALVPLLVAQGAHAQDAARAPAPVSHPPVPAFESVFKGYRPFSDEKTAPWKEANDTVGRIGGWRAYAREAHAPAPGAATPAEGVADPHADHHKP